MNQRLPLAIAQHEVLQDQRAWPQSPHLLVGGLAWLIGEVDEGLLRTSMQALVDEQPVLRLIPGLQGQRLLAQFEAPLIELAGRAGLSEEAALLAQWQDWTREAPPLGDEAEQPPWRMGMLRFASGRTGLLLWAHHSLLDGYATAQLLRRWSELYCAMAAGQAPPPALPQVFLQHLQDDAAYAGSAAQQADAEFWSAELPAAPAPLFAARPLRGELPAALLATAWLPRAEYGDWAGLARLEAQTEFATLCAALAWHYAALLGRDEILIGVPTLNRHGRAERQALGMFVGVMPLRLQLGGLRTPRELIALVGRQLRRAMRHARYPASSLARQLRLAQAGRDHLFDLLLSFERQDFELPFGERARLAESRQLFCGLARFPLSLTLCDFGAGRELALSAEGSTALFDERGLALLLQRLRHLAAQMAAQPEAELRSLALLPPAEREAVVEGLHRDLASLSSAPSFIERFLEQASLHPHSYALVWDGGSLSYGLLAERALALAGRLLAAGLRPGEAVALALPRGPELLVALLAVARAGAYFVPLDLDWPDERLRQLLAQLGGPLWLGLDAHRERLAPLQARWLAVDGEQAPASAELPPLPPEGAAAYALFTSGSTGAPKAVRVPHGALARRFAWLAGVWNLGPADRSLQGTAAVFDPSLIELLLPLTLGASVALPPPGRLAPETWAAFAARQGCSFTALVPTTLARLLDGIEVLPEAERERLRLRVACSGGEVLSPQLAQRWLRVSRAALWNFYGPTEACIFATAWACRDGDGREVLPVGSPVDDSRLYVLDEALNPLPFGSAGDIWLGGPTLAIDYLGQPEATAQRFRADPFQPGGRIYKTGDRGCLDGDGRLQFLGRGDRQLKIRGQRVEPGELEAALLALPGVEEAAVLALGEPPRLHAWLAPQSLDLGQLQGLARERLPEVLLPAGWTLLPTLPRGPTGKLDAARLPPPGQAGELTRREPQGQLETELLALLRTALRRDDIGVDADFFHDAGGDSLAALDWLTAIEQRTGLRADLALLAQAPTVAQLAARLGPQARTASASASAAPLSLALSQPEGAPLLFLAASGHGDLLRFQQLADALAPGCGLRMLQPPPGLPVASLAELAAAYGEHIRAEAGDSPVLLAGFSVGGVAALETARWLQAQGAKVQALVLIDSVFPRWLFRQPWLWKLLGWLTRSLYVQELSMNGRRLGAMFKDAGLVGQVLALHAYRLAPYPDEVLLLRTSGLARWQDWLFGPWRRQLRLRELEVQGLHGSIFEAGRVLGLAQCLRQALRLEPLPPP